MMTSCQQRMFAFSKTLHRAVPRKGDVFRCGSFNRRELCTCIVLNTKKRYEPPAQRFQNSLGRTVPEFSIRGPEFYGLTSDVSKPQKLQLQENYDNSELERQALRRKLFVDLDDVKAAWNEEFALLEISNLCTFYKIAEHMFDKDSVHLTRVMNVRFTGGTEMCRGNILSPAKAVCKPFIEYEASSDELFTLIMTSLDGHPIFNTKELLHWNMVNIRGNDLSSGDTIFEYLPPVPWQGTGFHRIVCALFRQRDLLDAEKIKSSKENTLVSRTFSTPKFIASHEGSAESLTSHEGSAESLTSHEGSVEPLTSHKGSAEPLTSHKGSAESLTTHEGSAEPLTSHKGSAEPLTLVSVNWCQAQWDHSVSESYKQLTDLSGEPVFDWESYLAPKEEKKVLKSELKELNLRNS